MGTIEKRGKNSWRVGAQVLDKGSWKWVRRSVTFPATMPENEQRHAADIALARLIVDIEDGKAAPGKQQTVKDLAQLWMDNHVKQNCEPDTVKTYRNFLDKRILPMMGDVPLCQITPLMMSAFIARLAQERVVSRALPDEQLKHKRSPADAAKMSKVKDMPLSARTMRHYYDTLSSIFKQAVKWELMYRNPMDGVTRPKVRKKPIKFLDDESAVKLLRCLKDEENMSFRAAVLLALTCGLRLGEVGALNLKDVDWENSSIDIQRARKYTPEEGSFDGHTKTESSERLIALPAAVLTLLDETRRYQEEIAQKAGGAWKGDGRIVCDWDGSPYHHDTPSKQWRVFADKNGFKGVRFHDLRHTHATLLFANNMDAVAVASRLGHSDAGITLRTYAHALRRRDTESASIMDKLFQKADCKEPD